MADIVMACIVMAYIGMAYIVMAYVAMVPPNAQTHLCSYGLYRSGLCSYGLCSYDLCSHGLHCHGLCGYAPHSYGAALQPDARERRRGLQDRRRQLRPLLARASHAGMAARVDQLGQERLEEERRARHVRDGAGRERGDLFLGNLVSGNLFGGRFARRTPSVRRSYGSSARC